MSRSYRKFAVIKDKDRTSKRRFKHKTIANRAVRKNKDEIISGKSGFKKIYCSWNISDYRFVGIQTTKELKRQFEYDFPEFSHCKTYKDAYKHWKKFYKRK